MNKQILIEQMQSTHRLQYLKESGVGIDGKKYIGKLAGPAADLINPTRNGRKYSLQLWRNVENSDDFKEGMSTHTIFGEADHPEERLETSIKEIAICLNKFEIRENEGIVWCEFDILDTPNGRIVKELLDYGSELGVSSRGSGEEITNAQGETEIDPSTYLFICFDVVIMPAVKSARPNVVESKEYKKLSESVEVEIKNANTISELNSIKNVVEKTMPSNDSLLESINDKLNSLENGENISSKLESDLDESTSRIQELEDTNKKLEKKVSAYNIRIKEMANLIRNMSSNSKDMRKYIKESKLKLSSYEDSILEDSAQYEELQNYCESLKEKIDAKNSKLSSLQRSLERMRHDNSQLRENNKNLIESNESLYDMYNELKSDNANNIRRFEARLTESRDKNNSLNRQITENKNLKSKLDEFDRKLKKSNSDKDLILKENKELSSLNKDLIHKYIDARCSQLSLSKNEVISNLNNNFSMDNIDKVINEAFDKRVRLNKLPISTTGIDKVFISTEESSSEDLQTKTILESAIKKQK